MIATTPQHADPDFFLLLEGLHQEPTSDHGRHGIDANDDDEMAILLLLLLTRRGYVRQCAYMVLVDISLTVLNIIHSLDLFIIAMKKRPSVSLQINNR